MKAGQTFAQSLKDTALGERWFLSGCVGSILSIFQRRLWNHFLAYFSSLYANANELIVLSFQSLIMCLETQFDSVIVDRPMVLQSLYQLHNSLSDRKILSWEFFLNRFDALFIEAQIHLEKTGDIPHYRGNLGVLISLKIITIEFLIQNLYQIYGIWIRQMNLLSKNCNELRRHCRRHQILPCSRRWVPVLALSGRIRERCPLPHRCYQDRTVKWVTVTFVLSVRSGFLCLVLESDKVITKSKVGSLRQLAGVIIDVMHYIWTDITGHPRVGRLKPTWW